MTKLAILALALTLTTAACDGGVSTPEPVQLAGTWEYSTETLTGDGMICETSGKLLHLTVAAETVSGTTSLRDNQQVGCTRTTNQGTMYTPNPGGYMDVEGTIEGSQVTLVEQTVDAPEPELEYSATNVGRLDGNVITGTVTVRDNPGTGTRTLTGRFRAVRR